MKRLVLGAVLILTTAVSAANEVSRTEFTYDRYTKTIVEKRTGSWVAFLTKEEKQALISGRAHICVVERRRGAKIGEGTVNRYCR